jgi:hypothetical protein
MYFFKIAKIFLKKHSTFKKLRNCGNKSNEELIAVCKKYHLDNEDFLSPEKKENQLEKIVFELTRIQREVINSFIIVVISINHHSSLSLCIISI